MYRWILHPRWYSALTREQLGTQIKAAFTSRDSQGPATVRHWDTAANVRTWLVPFTKKFAAGCMEFRHFRFFRSSVDGRVLMQNTTNISSWGDASDKWRGLQPLTHHTSPFSENGGLGIPDLWAAFKENALPKALIRPGNINVKEEVVKSMKKLHESCPAFGAEELAANLRVAELYNGERAEFPWSEEDVESLFKRNADEEDGPGAAAGAFSVDGALPVPRVGQCYLVRPDPDDDDLFLLGICRAVQKDRQGKYKKAHIQFFQQEENACPYQGMYTSVLQPHLASNRFPLVEEMQFQLNKIARVKIDKAGNVKSFYLHKVGRDLENIKWYVEEWANGLDLQDRPYERTISQEFLHSG